MRLLNHILKACILYIAFTSAPGEAKKEAVMPAEKKDPLKIPATEYVTIDKDGHLQLHGKRARFWGTTGFFPARYGADEKKDCHALNTEIVHRLKLLGFNMVRFHFAPDEKHSYVKGDGSGPDILDHFFWRCREEGIRVWWAGFGNEIPHAQASDVDIIDDPKTAQAWKEAIESVGKDGFTLGRYSFANMWDPRLKAIRIAHLKNNADRFNQYTGLRYADDPTIAVWELINEDWWFYEIMRGQHLRLPKFFLDELYAQWNAFLTKKYKNDESLRKAWAGNLLDGESLVKNSVLLLPLGEDLQDEAQARSLGVNIQHSVKAAVSKESFNGIRGGDVIEFLTGIWIQAKKEESTAAKKWGRSLALCPMTWVNGIGYDMPTQYFMQHADAISHDSYVNGTMHPDPKHKRYPWYSALDELPKVCWNKPWLEQNRMPGKPFFVYENQIMQPAKYRGEHPVRMAAIGAIQDWDIIMFHYWGHPQDPKEEEPYTKKMDYTFEDGHCQGYHFQFDAVEQSAISFAGEIFKNGLLKPAPNPTTFIFGRNSLYNMNMRSYGSVGELFLPTAYRYGMRLLIDPTREHDKIIGESRARAIYEACPVEPNDQISIDWQRGHIIFDAPGAVTYCGFYAQYPDPAGVAFSNGIKLKSVKIQNDPGIPYPVTDDEKYVTFGIASRDGLPLEKTKSAWLSCMSTSFNSGFRLDNSKLTMEWFWPKGSMPNGVGDLPVLYASVEATLDVPVLKGMKYRFLGWHFEELKKGTIDSDSFIIPADKRIFLVELTR